MDPGTGSRSGSELSEFLRVSTKTGYIAVLDQLCIWIFTLSNLSSLTYLIICTSEKYCPLRPNLLESRLMAAGGRPAHHGAATTRKESKRAKSRDRGSR